MILSYIKLNLHFACILCNFDLVLPCLMCIDNYKSKNVLRNYIIPIIMSNDSSTRVFELHNKVNLTKLQPTTEITMNEFADLYKVVPVKRESLSITDKFVL